MNDFWSNTQIEGWLKTTERKIKKQNQKLQKILIKIMKKSLAFKTVENQSRDHDRCQTSVLTSIATCIYYACYLQWLSTNY